MIWSKLKQAVTDLHADAVKPHLRLHITRYGPGVSHIQTRGWMTWDGVEIANFATALWARTYYQQAVLGTAAAAEPMTSARNATAKHVTSITRDDFYAALAEYITLPIDAALRSPQVIIGAMAMFDKRVGKRRLRAMQFDDAIAPLVRRCYHLRCKVEGLAVASPNTTMSGPELL